MMIPTKYLAKMGEHSIKVNGIPVTVHVLDDPDLITYHIRKFEQSVLAADIQVVGLDYKKLKDGSPQSRKLILYASYCLIIHYNVGQNNKKPRDLPAAVHRFLLNTNICFVTPSRDCSARASSEPKKANIGIKFGQLAARVLNNPALMQMGLAGIAREVGVPYEGPHNGVGKTIELDKMNPMLMSQEQVKVAVSDASAHYRIGFQLLTSVVNQPDEGGKGSALWWFFRCFLP